MFIGSTCNRRVPGIYFLCLHIAYDCRLQFLFSRSYWPGRGAGIKALNESMGVSAFRARVEAHLVYGPKLCSVQVLG